MPVVSVAVETAVADSDKPANDKYRGYVSIVRPRGYEPRALPLRYPGEVLLLFRVARAMTIGF